MVRSQISLWRPQIVLLTSAIILLIVSVSVASAQSEGERYFDETGHTVRGPFLVFFESHGSLQVLGYPITDEFVHNGVLMQYFQRGRLEWHPDNPEDFQVQLGLLGDELNYDQPRLSAAQAANGPNCQYFSETGHSACNAFLNYFRDHGGVDVFGYPISEQFIDRDRIVQAFQRARMEWHPDKPANQKVQLTEIGRLAFDTFRLDSNLLKAKPPANRPYNITKLSARASVKLPVTTRVGEQTIYVVVKDQLGAPVVDARVFVVVHLPSGDQTYPLPATDTQGKTSGSFAFGQTRVGDYVFIDVTVTYGTITVTTRTSFLPWR